MAKAVIKKNKRKVFLEKECEICRKCKDRTDCNNRQGYEKCAKCKACKTKCLTYCDRFHCYQTFNAQITVNGKQKTIATGKDKEKVEKEKRKKQVELDEGNFIDKNNTTLLELMYLHEDKKFKKNKTKDSSFVRNYETIENIAKDNIAYRPMQKIKKAEIENFFESRLDLSQSSINKIYNAFTSAFRKAEEDDIIAEKNNPMKHIEKPLSNNSPKEVTAFETDEQIQIINYISSDKLTVTPSKKADKKTLENCIKFLFATGCRCGEACAIDYTQDIDFKNEIVHIKSTVTKKVAKSDKGNIQFIELGNNRKKPKYSISKGNTTKTGKVAIKKGIPHTRQLPFTISGDAEYLNTILEDQIEIAKNNPYNKNNLLFCNKDGSFITAQQLTNFLKRICRELGIKTELPTGCSIHMTKHSFVCRCIEAGIQLITISRFVGTSVQELEKTYTHILDRFRNTELEKLKQYYEQVNFDLDRLKICYKKLRKIA